LTIFHSDNDHKTIQASVKILREQLKGIQYREFHEYGHFCLKDLKTDAFPELLQELVGQ
jgi:hypothetical protein